MNQSRGNRVRVLYLLEFRLCELRLACIDETSPCQHQFGFFRKLNPIESIRHDRYEEIEKEDRLDQQVDDECHGQENRQVSSRAINLQGRYVFVECAEQHVLASLSKLPSMA